MSAPKKRHVGECRGDLQIMWNLEVIPEHGRETSYHGSLSEYVDHYNEDRPHYC